LASSFEAERTLPVEQEAFWNPSLSPAPRCFRCDFAQLSPSKIFFIDGKNRLTTSLKLEL